MTTTAIETQEAPVTGLCDRCTAVAALRVNLTSGGELLFCGHHYNKHKQALEPLTSSITYKN